MVYQYSVENQLVQANAAASTGCPTNPGMMTATLSYDPLGRLYQTTNGASVATQMLYDGDELVAEYDGAGSLLRRYVHGAGDDDPLVWYEGPTMGASSRQFLHADWQGSIVAVSDNAGNPIAVNAYDDYGVPNAGNLGRFQYTGQAWIPELGMYYYKARIYSPTLERFMQTDPIGYKDQNNLYAYVANDPIDMRDPTGTDGQSAWDGVKAWAADEWNNIETQFHRIRSDIETFPEHFWNGTTGLPPTLSFESDAASTSLQMLRYTRVAVAATTALRIEARAASLAKRAGVIASLFISEMDLLVWTWPEKPIGVKS